MSENDTLLNKLKALDEKYESYFKLIDEGKGGEIVRMKDAEIDTVKAENEHLTD